jgi:hypothetical protein
MEVAFSRGYVLTTSHWFSITSILETPIAALLRAFGAEAWRSVSQSARTVSIALWRVSAMRTRT